MQTVENQERKLKKARERQRQRKENMEKQKGNQRLTLHKK